MSVVDLNGIKSEIQSVLTIENNTSGSPIDLSNGLSSRVQSVLKLNPAMHTIQGTLLPAITIWTDNKTIEVKTIAKNQINQKRLSEINFKIAGLVFNQNYMSFDEDPSDEDCEVLMENIEEVLRGNSTLNDKVLWHFPTDVTYHNFSTNEETHYRVGIMNLKCMVYY